MKFKYNVYDVKKAEKFCFPILYKSKTKKSCERRINSQKVQSNIANNRIIDILKERGSRIAKQIRKAIFDNLDEVYLVEREKVEDQFELLENEYDKVLKKKKKKRKERMKMLLNIAK